MKLVRPAIALALGTSLVIAGTAGAATPHKAKVTKVCNLITDPKGNGSLNPSGSPVGTPNDDRLDILSADVVTSPSTVKNRKITAVFRMAKADGTSITPSGTHYNFYFNAPGIANQLYMEYFTGNKLIGSGFTLGYVDPVQGLTPIGGADGFISPATNEIHISGSVSDFNTTGGGPIANGASLTSLKAYTSVDGVAFIFYANKASSAKSYTVGSPSCVTPGK